MIRFENAVKIYDGGVRAVDNVSFEIPEGETIVLLGTSGSGKSTILRLTNRLIELTSGKIFIKGKNINDINPIHLRRSMGYAIQHIGLFPHMTISENISVVPKMLGWDKKKISEKTSGLLDMAGLPPEEFLDRFPSQLSGGQKQRVGVARALAADPPVVLMDEPFGALDPITREQLQNEFIELESNLNKTIVFVTHDVFEAVKMGDRIALLNNGSIEQIAAPAELIENPANEFVDSFLGQHRFQLALLTKTVREIMAGSDEHEAEEKAEEEPNNSLRPGDSLIDALDSFKKTGSSVLGVYEKGRRVFSLEKKILLRTISGVLSETGE
jgi:osmoprotectant transport system ATP-binding protein